MRSFSEYPHYSAASFMVGVIKGILNSSGLEAAVAVTYQTLSFEEKNKKEKAFTHKL